MYMETKILVVEDEKPIADILKFNLEKEGYKVDIAYDGEEALRRVSQNNPDLVLLDVMLPKLDGFQVCRKLREGYSIPILMLTAKEEEVDKVLGLEMGADDYITKPFGMRELLARVKANLRRMNTPMGDKNSSIITSGGLVIDFNKYEVKKEQNVIELTSREFELLKFLAVQAEQVFSREQLLKEVWGYEYYGDIRTVDVTIRRLREKVEDNASSPKYILTKEEWVITLGGHSMFKSIRYKFITIYFLLVLMAMVIVGVFLMQQFEQYHLDVVRGNLTQIAGSVMTTLQEIDWQNNKEEIQKNIAPYEKMGMEIYVIEKNNDFTIISSTNLSYWNQNAMYILDSGLILSAFHGETKEKDIIPEQELHRSSKNMVFPLYDEHSRIVGAVYLRQSLQDIYKTLDQSKQILTRATVLGLLITIFLGYLLAKSITGPINDVTIKAEKMAKGDFDQVVEVKSDDEIGQLASMFNYLTAHLKSVLQEMSNEKKKLDTVINNMADGLIAASAEGKIIHANPVALEMLKLDEKVLQQKTFDEVFYPLNEKLTLNYLTEEEKWYGSQIIDMEDGVKLRAKYAPIIRQDSVLEGLVLLLQDVTEHERLENMRKEFVANVSHELKTPLTTIKSYTETLLSGAMEDKEIATQFLTVVESETDRMTRLVQDLLQLSNLDYQQAKWNKQEININSIIEKAVFKVQVFANNKQQQILYKTPEEDIFIYADQDKIEQVVLNILSNAIKYTGENGKIEIEVQMAKDVGRIIIQDNGIGIPAKDLSRILKDFIV